MSEPRNGRGGGSLARVHTRRDADAVMARTGHADRVAALEQALPAGLALAGASHHGIGIPACVHSGQRAATATVARLAHRRQ